MKIIFYKFCLFIFLTLYSFSLNAEILSKIEIDGNERISIETIMVYGEIEKGKNYSQEDIDGII